MAGIGFQPAGTSPAGVGTPALATPPSGTIFRDEGTGLPLDARQLDPELGTYAIDSAGRVVGTTRTRHLLVMAIRNELGSTATRELGLDRRGLDRLTGDMQRRLLDRLTQAVQHLVDQRLVQVVGLREYRASRADGLREGRAFTRFVWRDLTTGQEFQEAI